MACTSTYTKAKAPSGVYVHPSPYMRVILNSTPPFILQVSPFHTYMTSYLPKLLLSSLPLSMVGALSDARTRSLLMPALGFIGLISALGHKEWRFVVYVVPMFNIAAARGAAWMYAGCSRFWLLILTRCAQD